MIVRLIPIKTGGGKKRVNPEKKNKVPQATLKKSGKLIFNTAAETLLESDFYEVCVNTQDLSILLTPCSEWMDRGFKLSQSESSITHLTIKTLWQTLKNRDVNADAFIGIYSITVIGKELKLKKEIIEKEIKGEVKSQDEKK